MKIFLIVFSLALLFVIGSAGMMRYFDNKNMHVKPKLDDKDKSDKPDKSE